MNSIIIPVNKKVLIAVVIILLLLLGAWFFMTKKSPQTSSDQSSNTTNETSSTSLKDLLTKGIAQSCTFSSDNSNGSVYVSGGSVRGDFDTTVNGKLTKSHMVVKGNASYIWTDDQTTGFKMAFDPNSVDANTSKNSTATNTGIDPAANNNYKCSAWIADSSKFELPTSVTFTSFEVPTGVNQTSPQGSSSGSTTSSQCSYCNTLTGDDKTQCLTALKCN